MKKSILTFLILFFAITTNCQTKVTFSKFNFDFERSGNGSPMGWHDFGRSNYIAALDSTNIKSGKYSVSIEFKEGNPGFRAWSFHIPDSYAGKKITLTGFIKTENVTDGYAGLLMRIDPSIAFDNMGKNGAKGTTDWTKYEITLDLNPKKTKQIVVGGLFVGKSTPYTKLTSGSIENPGLFSFFIALNTGTKNKNYYKGKVVVLINEITQSSAEFHTMAYRINPNTTVIGSATAGADGDVSRFYLPGGISTMISGIGVYYPDGKETQRIGIVPDIELKPTIQGIKEGRDELMEKAI